MKTLFRLTLPLSVLLLSAFLVACSCPGGVCHTQHSMPYTVSSVTLVNTSPSVHTGSITQKGITGPLAMVADIGSVFASKEQEDTLNRSVNKQEVALTIHNHFTQNYSVLTGIPVVNQSDPHQDAINIIVKDYGLVSEDISSPAEFFLTANVRVISRIDNRLIWDTDTTVTKTMAQLQSGNDPAMSALSATVSLISFFRLDDDEISAIFNALAATAGTDIANMLAEQQIRR